MLKNISFYQNTIDKNKLHLVPAPQIALFISQNDQHIMIICEHRTETVTVQLFSIAATGGNSEAFNAALPRFASTHGHLELLEMIAQCLATNDWTVTDE